MVGREREAEKPRISGERRGEGPRIKWASRLSSSLRSVFEPGARVFESLFSTSHFQLPTTQPPTMKGFSSQVLNSEPFSTEKLPRNILCDKTAFSPCTLWCVKQRKKKHRGLFPLFLRNAYIVRKRPMYTVYAFYRRRAWHIWVNHAPGYPT